MSDPTQVYFSDQQMDIIRLKCLLPRIKMSDVAIEPKVGDPAQAQDYDRMAHLILEGWHPEEGEFVSTGNSVIDAWVNGTPVKALCGKVWVPDRDPKKYPICETCKEIAKKYGWSIPE